MPWLLLLVLGGAYYFFQYEPQKRRGYIVDTIRKALSDTAHLAGNVGARIEAFNERMAKAGVNLAEPLVKKTAKAIKAAASM